MEDLPVSSRKYPFVVFKPERPCGDIILEVKGLCKSINGVKVLDNLDMIVNKGDRVMNYSDYLASTVVAKERAALDCGGSALVC